MSATTVNFIQHLNNWSLLELVMVIHNYVILFLFCFMLLVLEDVKKKLDGASKEFLLLLVWMVKGSSLLSSLHHFTTQTKTSNFEHKSLYQHDL